MLGADQVLSFEGALISKCETLGEAADLLRRLRGKSHRPHQRGGAGARTACPSGGMSSKSTLWMRAFSDDFLEPIWRAEGESLLACVGCYRLEGPGAQLFERIEGDYFSILGLAAVPLLAGLRELGILVK